LAVHFAPYSINRPNLVVRRINIWLGRSPHRIRALTDFVRIADRRTAPRAVALPCVDVAALVLNTLILGLILVLLSGAVWLNAT
jgi:hypothetical protein